MNSLAIEPMNGASKWVRVAKIVALFVVVGPLVASVLLIAEQGVIALSNVRYAVPLSGWPLLAASWIGISYMIGGPYILMSGGIFAMVAVFFGRHQLWLAIAIALAPLALVQLLPAFGEPIWRWESIFSMNALVLVVVSTTVCWYLSHRWLKQF